MPTVLRIKGYRFFFFSLEGNEPAHIHVEKCNCVAKFWLQPTQLASNYGFKSHDLVKLNIIVEKNRLLFMIKPNPIATDVSFKGDMLCVSLADGREISVPITWFPSLSNASEKERNHWRLIGNGIGVHWEALDEDIAVETLFRLE